MRLHPDDTRDRSPVWLLTLETVGGTWRLSTQDVSVTTDSGDVLRFEGVLSMPTVVEALASLGETSEAPFVRFDALWLPGLLELLAEGHMLEAGRGELAVWVDGMSYEQREILVAGRVSNSEAFVGDVAAVTIGDQLSDDRGSVLARTAIVDSSTHPSTSGLAVGAYYPIPFGRPGVWSDANSAEVVELGSPGLLVLSSGLLHHVIVADGAVEASAVTITNMDDGSSEVFATTLTSDERGRPYTICDVEAAATLTLDLGVKYAVSWHAGGGVLNERGALANGAGDVCLLLLRRSSVRIDWMAWEAARAELNRWVINGFIAAPTSPVLWIGDNILPLVPMSLFFGPRGLAPVLWRFGVLPSEVDAVVDVDTLAGEVELERGTGLRVAGSYVGEFRLAYARDYGDSYHRSRTLTGEDVTPSREVGTTAQLRSARAMALDQPLGVVPPQVAIDDLSTDMVSDEGTAQRVLAWRAALLGQPYAMVSYQASWGRASWPPGSTLLITHSALHLRGRVGQVETVTWTPAGPLYQIRLQLDVARDLRART